MHATGFPPNTGGDPPGTSADRTSGADQGPAAFPIHQCADGYITFSIVPGGLGLRHSTKVMKWIEECGELTGELEGADIDEWAASLGKAAMENPAEAGRLMGVANAVLHEFVAKRTMAECYERAVADGFMLAPLYTMEDIANDTHLAARDYWVEIDGKRYPGPYAQTLRDPAAPRARSARRWARISISCPKSDARLSARIAGPCPATAFAARTAARSRASKSPTSPGSAWDH